MVFVYRNDLVESIHQGDIAIVDNSGKVLYELGDSQKITYWRSAAKPIQALPVVSSGAAKKFNLTDRELSVICASHSGQKKHIRVVNNILEKLGLDESYLQCGIHPPKDKETSRSLWRQGKEPSPIYNNCSGKHAGLLALCKYYKWDLNTYLKPDHPLQKMLLKTISEITGFPLKKIHKGEDGCGVVVYGLPLTGMAYAYSRLANPSTMPAEYRDAARRINDSMSTYPLMVGGLKRFNTRLLEVAGDKLVAKSGAEGVFSIGLKEKGIGITIKVRDGRSRAVKPSVMKVLEQLEVLNSREKEKLKKFIKPPVKNHHDHQVGYLKANFNLKEAK